MSERKEYILEIKAFSPDTIPMGRLADYMSDLARLLGEEASVHFVRLDPGSTGLVHAVEFEAVPKVAVRLESVRTGTAPADAQAAFQGIDKKLREDNADGYLRDTGGAQIIQFPGARAEKRPDFGVVSQATVLDGRIIRMGGRGKIVPIMLQTDDGFETHCEATRETARELRNFYDGPTLRFSGQGKWGRSDLAGWRLERFHISSYEQLDERGLAEIVADLRGGGSLSIEGHASSTLRELRGDEESLCGWYCQL